jgi:hypothetical protein
MDPNEAVCLSENDREKSEEPHCDIEGKLNPKFLHHFVPTKNLNLNVLYSD